MFKRNIEKSLVSWKGKHNRKPLVIRGARQTGKTTLIREFAKTFADFAEVNLEKENLRKVFSLEKDVKSILGSLELLLNKKIIPGQTLLFLDEIQNSAEAIRLLRYFHEEIPELHVISAGSLLEVRMKKEGWSFPVGRVEFLYLYPFTLEEYLLALNQEMLLQKIAGINFQEPLPAVVHEKLLDHLFDYFIVGGMPEAVKEFVNTRSFISVKNYQDVLISSFKEDFVKYSKESEIEYLKLVWDKVPFELGNRIKYAKLGGGNSQKIARAFDILHEAMLIERIYPTIAVKLPLVIKRKAAPKAIFLDIGLASYILRLSKEQVKEKALSSNFSGALFEAFVAQELLAIDNRHRDPLYFWIREEKGTSSELDFLWQENDQLIPIEVKAGRQGTLKSLHQFLRRSGTAFGVRFNCLPPKMEKLSVTLPQGEKINYCLCSLPYYLASKIIDVTKEIKILRA